MESSTATAGIADALQPSLNTVNANDVYDISKDARSENLDEDIRNDIESLGRNIRSYLKGELADDIFRVIRLNNGIYGQRQGEPNQMVRVKSPGGLVTAGQLEAFAVVAEKFSRGWGHLTTRQNVQFHYVQLDQVPAALLELGLEGLTSREACGDTVRNVTACPLAGACPHEQLDVAPWAQATFEYFLRHPYGQRLPRKFKINFSGCAVDCGQAMFNDVGVVATTRTLSDGTTEAGFKVVVGGGLGTSPHPALVLEEFTSREDLLATVEAVLRTFDHFGNRDNKLRARLKWVAQELGNDELRRRIIKERRFLRASASWPGGVPTEVMLHGDTPAGSQDQATPVGQGVSVNITGRSDFERWNSANVIRGNARGVLSAVAYAPLGDITAEQFRGLAAIQRRLGVRIRITNRQNFVILDLAESDLESVHSQLAILGMAKPGAELARDVVSCPGADTCAIAVTQSRGLGNAISQALEVEGLAEVPGVRINISGCTNSCGQHHVADIGFFGAERRAHGRSAPGYQLLLGGHLGNTEVEFGKKATRLPAKTAPEAVVRLVRQFDQERNAGETFAAWVDRRGGAESVTGSLLDLTAFPTPEEAPDFYVDYGETGPYSAEIGEAECAAV